MMLNKKAVIGILIVFVALAITAHNLPFTGKLEAANNFENNSLNGEITSVNYEPSQPKILEKLSITAEIKNTGNEKNSYLLEFQITKNGQQEYVDDFTFSLSPDESVSFTPNYNPGEPGENNVVVRLYDKNKEKLYDEKILNLIVQSDVGPFDFNIDMPSHIIGLGDSLPITASITNMGTSGTDINLKVDVICLSGKKLSTNMYIFVNSSAQIKKQLLLETCDEVGEQSLTASINIYENELISSKNQFFMSSSLPNIELSTQHSIKVNSGEKINFGIQVTNPNNFNLININPFVYGVSPDWVLIEPSSYSVLKPNETVVFMVTINPPSDAETNSYGITIGVGGDNVFSKNDAVLSVTGDASKPLIDSISIGQLISSYWSQIVLAIAVVLVLVLFFRRKGKKESGKPVKKKSEEAVKKIDDEYEELKQRWKNKKSEQAKK